MRPHQARGFTLIELVVSMAIAAVIVGFIGMFMATPMEAYRAQTRRTDLVDSADAIVRAFDQDLATALPNSVRLIPNGVSLLATAGSARYWEVGDTTPLPGGDPVRELDFASADTQFATDGQLNQAVHALAANSFYLVVNNLGTVGHDAYTLTDVITPPGTSITFSAGSVGEDQVSVSPAFRFAQSSTTHTVYVVTQPVTYLCNPAAGTLTRYSGYTIGDPTLGGASSSLVARFVTACQFTPPVGTSQHGGLLGMQITLVNNGETLPVFHQVAVEGIP